MVSELCAFDEQLKRLKEAAEVNTDTALMSLLGVNASGVYNAKNRGSIPQKWYVAISTRFGVNLEWLVSGTGPRELTPSVQHAACPQCVELQIQLTVANERLFQSGERERDLFKEVIKLKDQIGTLEKELGHLKNGQLASGDDMPMSNAL